jgi:hypothetical protein
MYNKLRQIVKSYQVMWNRIPYHAILEAKQKIKFYLAVIDSKVSAGSLNSVMSRFCIFHRIDLEYECFHQLYKYS